MQATAKKSARTPGYRHHKPSGQAVVTLAGRDVYLGKFDSPESWEKYGSVIAEWRASGGVAPAASSATKGVLVADLLAAFLPFVEQRYRRLDGSETTEVDMYRRLAALVDELYGSTPAAGFGPVALKAVRQKMIERGWVRSSINKQVNRVRRIFKWGVAQELIPAGVYHGLLAVDGLRRGEKGAKEAAKKLPVPEAHIEAVGPFLGRHVQTMVDFQLLTGARPGEVVAMRPMDIDTDPDAGGANGDPAQRIWLYRPADHKTAHHGHKRVIVIGPRAQQVLAPFLKDRPRDKPIFSPVEAEAERRARQRERRKTPVQPSQVLRAERARRRQRRYPFGEAYTVASYRHAIARACSAADAQAHKENPEIAEDQAIIPHWHPHRLRHNAATRLRREFGLDVARTVLGHRTMDATEIYAEADIAKAREAIRKLG